MPSSIHPRKAFELLVNGGPRYYFETESVFGSGAHIDHAVWRHPGVRFLVHARAEISSVIRSAAEMATDLIDAIQDYKALFLSSQPAGAVFPGYGIRLPGVGGAYAYTDPLGLLPFASHHPDDSLTNYLNALQFTPTPQAGVVTTGGHNPTFTTFKIGSGLAAARSNGGFVNNQVTFAATTDTVDLRGVTRTVVAWVGKVATVSPALPAVPANNDACSFVSGKLQACYRFKVARDSLSEWATTFFSTLDSNWPSGLDLPEFVVCTTENIVELVSAAWLPTFPALADYLEDEQNLIEGDRSELVSGQSLTTWYATWGKRLNGSTIELDDAPAGVSQNSPEAQDYRSISYGAFVIGLAWTWQLGFVDRMKQTWPKCRFIQYQLHNGTRASPVRTQPGELFYHGEPWPPDVGHAHDEYTTIFPFNFRPSVSALFGFVNAGNSDTGFTVTQQSPFSGYPNWGAPGEDRLAFMPTTATGALRSQTATIADWDVPTLTVTCSELPATPANEDKFEGYAKEFAYYEWELDGIGWDIWPAFEALYGHTGIFEQRYRQTCISWVTEIAQRMTTAWPRHDVSPFMQRQGENLGPLLLEGRHIYPDPPVFAPPGIQPREDWVVMLSNMMDAGVTHTVMFEPSEESTLVLDSWVEIFSGVQEHYRKSITKLELIAPHQRNRHFRRNRRLWRH